MAETKKEKELEIKEILNRNILKELNFRMNKNTIEKIM